MKHLILLVGGLSFFAMTAPPASPAEDRRNPPSGYVLVIHGGAGVMDKAELKPEKEAAYRAGLQEALRAGGEILKTNGTSEAAVIAAIRVMEDSPLFNAGKGAVLTADGTVEMDAAIMDGASRKAGAVASVKHIKNPIELARLVKDNSPHVLLMGEGAERFAREQGMGLVEQEYFITEPRVQQLKKEQERLRAKPKPGAAYELPPGIQRFGTVGAVALDRRGNLCAGTSTGGVVNKRFGRVGDSPIIGAGTYADNRTCAVSATGHGEYFMRAVVAHDIAALIEYKGLSVVAAADEVVLNKLKAAGGQGGVIALDARGNFATPFNTGGMFRGVLREDGHTAVAVFAGEKLE